MPQIAIYNETVIPTEDMWIFTFLKMFIYLFCERERERERERARVSRGRREREGERESQAGSVLSVQSLTQGSISQTVRS